MIENEQGFLWSILIFEKIIVYFGSVKKAKTYGGEGSYKFISNTFWLFFSFPHFALLFRFILRSPTTRYPFYFSLLSFAFMRPVFTPVDFDVSEVKCILTNLTSKKLLAGDLNGV